MATLVDPYGYPVSSNILHGAQTRVSNRPYWPNQLRDSKKDIPYTDWRTIVSYSRRLYANDGLVKGAIDQLAQHAVGRAWQPHYNGGDREWGQAAQQWLTEEWFPVCDVRGEQWDFRTQLFNASVSLDVDGDFAVVLTEQGEGFPALQHIPAHKIGQRHGVEKRVEKGPLRGFTIEHGVILNDLNRIVGVRVLGDKEEDDRDLIASNIIFCFNATRFDQMRGLPSFSHAINELRDAWQAQQYEQITHQLASSISLVEHNESGGLDPNDPAVDLGTQGTNNESFAHQQFDGGLIRYFKAGSGSKLEEFATSKPGPQWESFQDRVFRKAIIGLGMPYSLIWKSDGLNGPAERSQIELARATIYDRQDVLKGVALREIRYALAKAMKSGRLKQSADWWRWDFTLPPKFSIDNGRDGQGKREDLKLGRINLRDDLGEQGRDYTEHQNQRAIEVVDVIKRAQMASQETGVPFETVLNLFTQRSPNPIMPATTAPLGRGPENRPENDFATQAEQDERENQ